MTWLLICICVAVVLGNATFIFLNAAMQGINETPLSEAYSGWGWLMLTALVAAWLAVSAGLYWAWRGIGALLS